MHSVAEKCSDSCGKIGMPKLGRLLGLLHDVGKYTVSFLNYFLSSIGQIDSVHPDYVDPKSARGKIDHSTAGAVYVYDKYHEKFKETGDGSFLLLASVCACALCGHHGNLGNIIEPPATSPLLDRLERFRGSPLHVEAMGNLEASIKTEIDSLIAGEEIGREIAEITRRIKSYCSKRAHYYMQLSLLVRLLHSCLIDADRTDAAGVSDEKREKVLSERSQAEWGRIRADFESHMAGFKADTPVNKLRAEIASECMGNLESSSVCASGRGILRLAVPTGGGKTFLASRIAFMLADRHGLSAVDNFAPFITIIEQNAGEVRKTVELDAKNAGNIVLEHHSNLVKEDERENYVYEVLTENWNSRIVFASSVQFFDCAYSGRSQNNRRLSALARSVIVFDEVQTVPPKAYFLFNAFVKFLTEICGSVVILSTATQPILDKLGAFCKDKADCEELTLLPGSDLIGDVQSYYARLRRVEVFYAVRPKGYTDEEVASFALERQRSEGSTLIVANTTAQARNIYAVIEKKSVGLRLFHLSANMCPAHRKTVVDEMKEALKSGGNTVCVSTQVIEAGVDISFGCCIRMRAGLDSIIQTAGRCNRHGERGENLGRVYVLNAANEREQLGNLPDILRGALATEDAVCELTRGGKPADLTSPEAIETYYRHYLYSSIGKNSDLPKYPADGSTVYDMLSYGVNKHEASKKHAGKLALYSSFADAAEHFKLIDDSGVSAIVPHGKGKKLIEQIRACGEVKELKKLLKKAQMYSVSVRDYVKLQREGIIYSGAEGTLLEGIYFLNHIYYHTETGFSPEPSPENMHTG